MIPSGARHRPAPEAWREILDRISGSRRRFLLATENVPKAQSAQLAEILHANRESAFGRAHDFAAIRSEQEYRRAVPLQTYETLAPYIKRTADGAASQLTTSPPVAFERTGGSSAGPKLIPYTRAGLEAIQRAAHGWLEDLVTGRPGITQGRCYFPISPAARPAEITPAGIPVGLASDAAYLGDSIESEFESLLIAPASSHSVDTWRSSTIAALREANDLTLISVWSPTFLLELLRHLEEDPSRLWPRLDTISCWTGASSEPFARRLADLFPAAEIQGKGLLATEGVVTIPLCGHPYPVLACESGYYEFLDGDGRPHGAAELSEDSEYAVVLTTHSGLYRYQLDDRVAVRGWIGHAPMLEFLGREAVSDLCGEKLSESFVQPLLRRIQSFRLLTPMSEPRCRYALILDAAEHDELSARASAGRLDRELRANPQYDYARALGQLAPVIAVRVPRAMIRYYDYLSRSGRRVGDIKPPGFSPRGDWLSVWHEHLPLPLRTRH